ncbi:glycogen synthase GlgA [Stenotrophomonas sp. C3(2023)]|uniref:glycogen synthase GlgA n=1 Tax=Stenotrophomonas sp. C3(2023) TaxID=3080277 RepID=UPI00293C5E1E|nr:glycogen synthase GlgA [Stenotrophomonas sp. C3(2023)]MDV3468597.1 glycogen synthase GlgA [Stenotrophomonas sp. C3(2023)]
MNALVEPLLRNSPSQLSATATTPRRRDARGRFAGAGGSAQRRERVLFVASEMADFIKAGGLGDVAASLPRALRSGCDVRVLIPGYPAVLERLPHLQPVGVIAPRAGLPECVLACTEQGDGLPIYVLLNAALFEREGSPYVDEQGAEWPDNALRFATLAHAAAEIAAGHGDLEWSPQLLHLNDWPGALAAAYVRWNGTDVSTLLTIHNLAYQGLFPSALAPVLGVPAAHAHELDFHGRLSFLRGGIVHATRLNTVSLRYAEQITDERDGCGLHGLLAQRAERGHLSGIVNGIDESWDPRSDHHLRAHFSADQISGRAENARSVRETFRLHPGTGPLFAVVSRLVHQKGIDITCEVAPQIIAAGGQLVIIGGGEPAVEQQVRELAQRYPGQVGAWIGFEERLARQMFAGADFLLMPSRFEPCGLSQMYAQRFGCLPIAHATGGLVDTVDDGVTGFLFEQATADGMRRCVERAMRTWRLPVLLKAMRRAAMLRPSGWKLAGGRYLDLYRQAIGAAA